MRSNRSLRRAVLIRCMNLFACWQNAYVQRSDIILGLGKEFTVRHTTQVDLMRHSAQNITTKSPRRDQVLLIADSCFEMFTIQELRRPRSIIREVAVSFSDSTEAEVLEAIALALSWRRMFHGSARFIH
jgi:hypothetical protein